MHNAAAGFIAGRPPNNESPKIEVIKKTNNFNLLLYHAAKHRGPPQNTALRGPFQGVASFPAAEECIGPPNITTQGYPYEGHSR
jgi:hypothetical protein